MDSAATRQGDAANVRHRRRRGGAGDPLDLGHVDLVRLVPSVRQDRAVASNSTSVAPIVFPPPVGDDEIGVREGLRQWGCPVPIEHRRQARDRIGVDHSDLAMRVPEVLGHPTPAPAVPDHHHALTVRDPVREPQVRLEAALPDRVLVLGERLDRTVVDHEDRQVQSSRWGSSTWRPEVVPVPPRRPS